MTARIRPAVVLFRPDDADIASLLALADWGWYPVAVVNAAASSQIEAIRAAGVECIENPTNLGLAHALNQGIERVFASGAEYVLLLDQDSRPPRAMLQDLVARADGYVAGGGRLGCLGPRPVDRKDMADRIDPAGPPLVPAASIITSGKLIPRSAYDQIGGMWDELFIDYVDHEWCFRAHSHGLAVLMAVDVPMPHDLGDALVGPAGFQRILHRSPVRHYHLVRNALWMRRCAHVPRGWRLGELARLAYRIPTFLVASTERRASLDAIRQGLRDGLAGPSGNGYSAASASASASAG